MSNSWTTFSPKLKLYCECLGICPLSVLGWCTDQNQFLAVLLCCASSSFSSTSAKSRLGHHYANSVRLHHLLVFFVCLFACSIKLHCFLLCILNISLLFVFTFTTNYASFTAIQYVNQNNCRQCVCCGHVGAPLHTAMNPVVYYHTAANSGTGLTLCKIWSGTV